MIISRTPFRISFFGGGTDYPVWFKEHGGAVLSSSIDKYCYINCRYLPPFFSHRSRIVWSRIETVVDVSEIQHPSVRETLTYLNVNDGVEIHHDGDLPARAGLGSSSSFTVGLLHGLYRLKGIKPNKTQLALDAIEIEQNRLKENVGSQDQVIAAFGGFNRIEFYTDGSFDVRPIGVSDDRLDLLTRSLMLFFTGVSRTASEIAVEQVNATPTKIRELNSMYRLVEEAASVLCSDAPISDFGQLLNESWELKKSLSMRISTPHVDEIYRAALGAGAIGGKLLGAGGGGFMLFFVPQERQVCVKEALKNLLHVPFGLESNGSQILFSESSSHGLALSDGVKD